MTAAAPDLLGIPSDRLGAELERIGVPGTLASRVFRALHKHRRPLASLHDVGPRHAARIDQRMRRADREVRIERVDVAPDGTEKLVFRLADGERVEGVLMPPLGAGRRTSFCVSSQVGCAMGCEFCATATLGLKRGLEPGEIVAQVRLAADRAAARGHRLSQLVFMGMGEPLHHYANTRDALSILTDPRGPGFGTSHVRVSTVGLAPRIRQLGEDFGGRIQLALSLNGGTLATRRRLMPVTARYDLDALREAIAAYPRPGKRLVMIEYVLLPGVTDTRAELEGLAAWMDGLGAVVNLIPFNPFDGAPFRAPSGEEIATATHALRDLGIPCKVRRPRGRPAAAACGQLALATG